jgi:hypothetical protein
MFRLTQEPSSGSYFVLSLNYNYDSIVLVVNDVVNVMAAYQPVVHACTTICRHNIDCVINDEHNRIKIVALAKHEIAPWRWFLREPKHVGPTVEILTVFNIPVIL